MVSSYHFSTWRIIICTPVKLEEHGQGEKQKNKKSNLLIKTNKQFTHSLSHAKWVGGFVALFLLVIAGFVPLEVHAADRSWGNIDLAKKVIDNVSPVISENKTENTAASLVFASDEFLQKPLVVETIVTKVEKSKPVVVRSKAIRQIAQPSKNVGISTDARSFPYGYCTYYVAQKRNITWSGNANAWLSNAAAQGYAIGQTPQVGAIVSTAEGGWTGHVAMVDAVNGDGTITISEMNFKGFGVISSRTIPISYGRILGYIY